MLEDILCTLPELCLVWIRIDWAGGRNEWQDVRGDTGRDRRGRNRGGKRRGGKGRGGKGRGGKGYIRQRTYVRERRNVNEEEEQ